MPNQNGVKNKFWKYESFDVRRDRNMLYTKGAAITK